MRRGNWRKPTSGWVPDYVQGNVAILPAELAADFHRFCLNNPKPVLLLVFSYVSTPDLPSLGQDLSYPH